VLPILLVVQVIRRAGNYAIMKPAREMLYVVLSRKEKYKAKNVIDTVVYRTGDAVSAWVYAGMRSIGLNVSAIALIAVPLALVWAFVAYGLGREQVKIAQKSNSLVRNKK
jgi:AAA family ATP:ADP antiporter